MLTELSGVWTEKPKDEIPHENSNNLGQIVHIWYLHMELFRFVIFWGTDFLFPFLSNRFSSYCLFFPFSGGYLWLSQFHVFSEPCISQNDIRAPEKGRGVFSVNIIHPSVFSVIHILTILFILVVSLIFLSLESSIRYFLRLK